MDVFGFNSPIVRHEEKNRYLQCLLRVMLNVNVTSGYSSLYLFCIGGPVDGFYLVENGYPCWLELELERWYRHQSRVPRFVCWYSLNMFLILLCERNDFGALIAHGGDYDSNRLLEIPTEVLFSYLGDLLRMST